MMRKVTKIMVLALLLVGLASGSAFAASLNAGNTTVASELVPAAGLAIPAVNTAYQSTGPVATSSQIKISLTNGTFTAGGNVTICDSAGLAAGTYGTAVVPAAPGNTSVTITTTKPLASGTVYNFQHVAVCVAGAPAMTNVSIAAGAVGGAVVTMTVDNALSAGDPNLYATAPVTTLVNQLSAQLVTRADDVINFTAVPTMTSFKTGLATSTAKFVILSDETLGQKVASGHAGSNTTCSAWPATAEALKFTVTPGGSATTMGSGFHATAAFRGGVASGFTLKAAIAATDTSASGTGTITGNLTSFSCGAGASATLKGTAANQLQLQLTVNGTTALTARSYNAAVETTTSGAIVAAGRTILAATEAWRWTLDASQYYIPLIGSNAAAGRETYIKLQSKSTLAGSNGVSVAILANDGSTAATWSGNITAGTPLTITGAQLIAAATAAGKTVDGQAGFAVIVTVNAPENDVFAYANMIESTGAKRIPVKTVGGANVE